MSPAYERAQKIVCHCLQISEEDLMQAIDNTAIRTLGELICSTKAGDGCTACRARLGEYLGSQSR